jgi:hypothetical protein
MCCWFVFQKLELAFIISSILLSSSLTGGASETPSAASVLTAWEGTIDAVFVGLEGKYSAKLFVVEA